MPRPIRRGPVDRPARSADGDRRHGSRGALRRRRRGARRPAARTQQVVRRCRRQRLLHRVGPALAALRGQRGRIGARPQGRRRRRRHHGRRRLRLQRRRRRRTGDRRGARHPVVRRGRSRRHRADRRVRDEPRAADRGGPDAEPRGGPTDGHRRRLRRRRRAGDASTSLLGVRGRPGSRGSGVHRRHARQSHPARRPRGQHRQHRRPGQPLGGDGQPGLLADAGCPEDVAVGPDGRVYFASLTASRSVS
ncbi:MAG: hypothetical protein AB1689_21485 [Thermodesulfobacteriota bacterium]